MLSVSSRSWRCISVLNKSVGRQIAPWNAGQSYLLTMTSKSDDDTNKDNSIGRLGGRKQRKPKQSQPQKKKLSWGFLVIPLLLLALLRGIFFVGFSDPSFVYYESSVYETRTYNNGNIERSRKESFRSNIPGLVERSATISKGPRELQGNDDNRLRQSIDETTENILLDDAIRRFERSILDDMF